MNFDKKQLLAISKTMLKYPKFKDIWEENLKDRISDKKLLAVMDKVNHPNKKPKTRRKRFKYCGVGKDCPICQQNRLDMEKAEAKKKIKKTKPFRGKSYAETYTKTERKYWTKVYEDITTDYSGQILVTTKYVTPNGYTVTEKSVDGVILTTDIEMKNPDPIRYTDGTTTVGDLISTTSGTSAVLRYDDGTVDTTGTAVGYPFIPI